MENVFSLVFGYLQLRDQLILGEVNKKFYELSCEDQWWIGIFPAWYRASVTPSPSSWKLNYISQYKKVRGLLEGFNPPKGVAVLRHFSDFNDETYSVRVLNNAAGEPVTYMSTSNRTVQLNLLAKKEGIIGISPTVGINFHSQKMSHYKTLLACASQNDIYLIDTIKNNSKFDNYSVVAEFKANDKVTDLKFSGDGRFIFSSIRGNASCVNQWDIEKQSLVHSFTDNLIEEELATYDTRFRHALHSVCPTHDGSQFICGSYSYYYHWDTRSGHKIKTYELYQPPATAFYPLSNIFFINNQSEVVIYGTRPSKFVVHSFPSFAPAKSFEPFVGTSQNKTFEYMPELYALDFSNEIGIGADSYGSFCLFNNITKKSGYMSLPSDALIGSGANNLHISDDNETVGVSFINPGSGYFRTKFVAFSARYDYIYSKSSKDKKCSLQ